MTDAASKAPKQQITEQLGIHVPPCRVMKLLRANAGVYSIDDTVPVAESIPLNVGHASAQILAIVCDKVLHEMLEVVVKNPQEKTFGCKSLVTGDFRSMKTFPLISALELLPAEERAYKDHTGFKPPAESEVERLIRVERESIEKYKKERSTALLNDGAMPDELPDRVHFRTNVRALFTQYKSEHPEVAEFKVKENLIFLMSEVLVLLVSRMSRFIVAFMETKGVKTLHSAYVVKAVKSIYLLHGRDAEFGELLAFVMSKYTPFKEERKAHKKEPVKREPTLDELKLLAANKANVVANAQKRAEVKKQELEELQAKISKLSA